MIQDFGGYRLPLVTRILSPDGYRLHQNFSGNRVTAPADPWFKI